VYKRQLLLSDLIITLGIACIIFGICLVNIWLTSYFTNRYNDNLKEARIGALLSYPLASIPMIAGLFSIKFIFNSILGDINIIYPQFERNAEGTQYSDDRMLIAFFLFLIILFALNYTTRLLLNFIVVNDAKKNLELENAQLRIKNIEATYQQLKMQIHPHFLFNSLSALKTLIGDNPDNAKLFLKRLSDFLRASIEFNNNNLIEVSKELKLCMDYLQLQKARFGDALRFTIDVPEHVYTDFVPLFSIQQLLENAIKHNILRDDLPLIIKIGYEGDWITISNNKQIKRTSEESAGTGLANLTERYKLLSGDEPVIKTDENSFSVSIKVLKQ
jgi:sensor histidine kinase YesM